MTAIPTNTQVSFNPERFPKAALLFNAAHSGKYRVIVCGGAIRGGKSFGVGGVLVTLHKRFPYSRSIVVRDSLQTLRITTLPTVEKLIPQNFIKKFKGDPQFQWKFTNNSSFQFFSEQDATDPERKRWNGLETNYIWLEQAEELQEATYDKALERLGSYFIPKHLGLQPPPILFVTVNPTDTWAKTKFYEPWLNGTLPDHICYIPMTIDDNGGLEPSFRESLNMLRQTNPIKYKIFVEGRWDVREKTGGEWYHEFDYGKHTVGKDKGGVPFLPSSPGDVHGTYDFNTVPYMTLLLFQPVRSLAKVQLRFFKEYCLASPNNSTAKVCEFAARDYLFPFRRTFTYYGDRQGENRVEGEGNFRRFDRVRSTLAPFLHSRSNQVNKAVVVNTLMRDFINDVLAGLVPGVEILIDEDNCPNLIKDLATTKEVSNGIKKEIGKDANGNRYEKNGHCLSAFTYGVGTYLYDIFLQWKKRRGKIGE
ncbi:phage terminase large subunit [Spirosoma litoris]